MLIKTGNTEYKIKQKNFLIVFTIVPLSIYIRQYSDSGIPKHF